MKRNSILDSLFGKKPVAPPKQFDRPELEAWITARLAESLQVDSAQIEPERPFAEFGLDSRTALALSGELEDMLGRELPPTLLWDFPNVRTVAAYLAGEIEAPPPVAVAEEDLYKSEVKEYTS